MTTAQLVMRIAWTNAILGAMVFVVAALLAPKNPNPGSPPPPSSAMLVAFVGFAMILVSIAVWLIALVWS